MVTISGLKAASLSIARPLRSALVLVLASPWIFLQRVLLT
jgi:hypothetical protein